MARRAIAYLSWLTPAGGNEQPDLYGQWMTLARMVPLRAGETVKLLRSGDLQDPCRIRGALIVPDGGVPVLLAVGHPRIVRWPSCKLFRWACNAGAVGWH